MTSDCVAQRLLRDPEGLAGLSDADWDLALRQARNAGLLARLWVQWRQRGITDQVPSQVARHFDSAYRLYLAQERVVAWEVKQLSKIAAGLGIPLVLLKGSAYLMSGLPVAQGRLFNDIDILVPKGALNEVEAALARAGWVGTHQNAYDQQYYRRWMHELPPMRHLRRDTLLDVHHGIAPETARVHPDAAKLLAAARPLDGYPEIYVLDPLDMILHSAVHLFSEGEFDHGLRDTSDLDLLLRHFGREDGFWPRLAARAEELGLQRSLHYALRYSRDLLATPVPDPVGAGAPRHPRLMDALFERALRVDHPSCDDRWSGLARWLLYVRGHYLRMPLHLLVPHLLRKAVMERLPGESL